MKEQMARASQLIKAKQYSEARKLLKTIDHPKAKEWLGKLDQIAPERKPRRWWVPALIVVLVAIGGLSAALYVSGQNAARGVVEDARQATVARLTTYCEEHGEGTSDCPLYARSTLREDARVFAAQSCFDLYADDAEAVGDCLLRAGMPLP